MDMSAALGGSSVAENFLTLAWFRLQVANQIPFRGIDLMRPTLHGHERKG